MFICEKSGRCVDPCDNCEHHIEVEPVVRCKDCFHKEDTKHDRLIHCVQLDITVPDIFYCCYGEWRTD